MIVYRSRLLSGGAYLCLPAHAGHGLDGVKQLVLGLHVLDVRVDQQRVHLGVDVLDGDLEAVETPGLGHLRAKQCTIPVSHMSSWQGQVQVEEWRICNLGGKSGLNQSKTRARYLDLAGEVEGEVLVDDAVRGGEEGEHVADEVPLVVAQVLPVLLVVGQVELLGGPEAGLRLLVLVPDLKTP